MGRIKRSLVHKLLRAADTPFFELPQAWSVFSRYRTAELFLKHPAPPSVVYNDAPMYHRLLRKYPEVKLEPLRINSTQPSLARSFVEAQQQELAQHVAQLAAEAAQQQPGKAGQQLARQRPSWRQLRVSFQKAEAKMQDALKAAGRETSAGGYLEYIQQQEEEALQAALKKLQEQQAAGS